MNTYDTNDLIEGIYYNIPLSFEKRMRYKKKVALIIILFCISN